MESEKGSGESPDDTNDQNRETFEYDGEIQDTNSSSSSKDSLVAASSDEQSRSRESNWSGSLVEYYGPSSSFCGYCKQVKLGSDGGRRSYDMQAYRLTASDYQEFLDKGWRRSGEFCYCPINQTTCCPNFSITCHAIKFQLSRSQRRCIERLNNYLVTGSIKQNSSIKYYEQSGELFRNPSTKTEVPKSFEQLKASSKAKDRRFVKTCERKSRLLNISIEEALDCVVDKWRQARPAKLSLEDYLYPLGTEMNGSIETNHKLVINLYHVNSKQSKALRNEEQSIIVKYQKHVHKETRREWTMSRYCDFLVKSPIIVEPLKNYNYLPDPDDEDELTKEILSRDVYKDSLNKSFLLHRPPQLPTAYGTFHCSYHLDEKLIAVGVLDVLPKCITTVYFFYDPDYAFLNLGVYSALVEISMIRQMWSRHKAQTSLTDDKNILEHYYLGYYVHECKKMHYKTKFKPSYLLCCKSYEYISTQECLKKLEHNKYSEFSDSGAPREAIEFKKLLEVSIEWPLDIDQYAMTTTKLLNYLIWLESKLGTEYVELFVNGYLATFAHLVGPDLLTKLCLKTNIVHKTLIRRRDRMPQFKQQRPTMDGQSSRRKKTS